jgi:hypothetical protein
MAIKVKTAGPLTQGKEIQVMKESPTSAGTQSIMFSVDAETVLVSLAVVTTAGDLDVKVYTQGGDDGQELNIISFPTISAPTTTLVLKKAAQTLQRVRVEATYTGSCSFVIRVRGISGGTADVRILGASNASATATVITATPGAIVPASLTDRKGVVIKNNNTSGILYLGFSMAEAAIATGYPVGPQEALALDVDSGVEVYGVSDSSPIDIRLLEAGG